MIYVQFTDLKVDFAAQKSLPVILKSSAENTDMYARNLKTTRLHIQYMFVCMYVRMYAFYVRGMYVHTMNVFVSTGCSENNIRSLYLHRFS